MYQMRLSLSALAVNHSLCWKGLRFLPPLWTVKCHLMCRCVKICQRCILGLDFLQKQQCVVDYKQKVLKAGDATLHTTKRLSPSSFFNASLVNTLKLPPFTKMMVLCKIIGHEFSDGSDVYVEKNETLLGKYETFLV